MLSGRQVDVFEDATLRGRVREPTGTHPVGVDGQQFAGLDVSNERRTDDVEGSGLGGDDPAAVQAPQRQRTHPERVAGCIERVFVHKGQREGTPDRRKQFEGRLLQG